MTRLRQFTSFRHRQLTHCGIDGLSKRPLFLIQVGDAICRPKCRAAIGFLTNAPQVNRTVLKFLRKQLWLSRIQNSRLFPINSACIVSSACFLGMSDLAAQLDASEPNRERTSPGGGRARRSQLVRPGDRVALSSGPMDHLLRGLSDRGDRRRRRHHAVESSQPRAERKRA
jgi:hypothetical protein